MVVKVTKLIWKDVGIRNEVKGCLPKLLLHAHEVEAETVLAGNLVALRKMVYLLVLVQALVLIGLTSA
jgi:hypothetical protein